MNLWINPEMIDEINKFMATDNGTIVKGLIAVYGVLRIHRNFRMQKKYYNKKQYIEIKEAPKTEEHESIIKKDRLKYLPHHEEIEEFADILYKNFNGKDCNNFMKNLKNLYIKDGYFIRHAGVKIGGMYNVRDNEMVIGENSDSIYHELFHMSSSKVDGALCISGFGIGCAERKNKFKIGHGIDEGYTEYLAQKYCKTKMIKEEDGKKIGSYVYEVFVTGKIEKIVGEEKMKSLYLNADLNGLINELTKYNTKENTLNAIQKLDFLNVYLYKPTTIVESIHVQKSANQVNEYLLESYLNKVSRKIKEEKEYSMNQLFDMANFATELNCAPIFSVRGKYRPLSEAKTKKIIDHYITTNLTDQSNS